MKNFFLLILMLCFGASSLLAQVTVPPSGGNQKAMVQQNIGPLVTVNIQYSSPDVTAPNGTDRKGKIWGQLVPYGFTKQGFGLNNPSPWRAGANECTVITFSHDVEIEGKPLAAGSYALFLAPAESGPWTYVFNKNTAGWGSYFYEEKDNALTVQVTPEEAPYHEWLSFEFTERLPNSTVAALVWENKRIPFKIEVPNNNQLIVDNMRDELIGSVGFTWTNLNTAANFCLNNNIELEQALAWATTASTPGFSGNPSFATLATKGQILAKLGRTEEAEKTMEAAIKHPTAGAIQIHQYGRQLLAGGNKEKALKIFTYNMEKNGDVWPVRVGLARAHSAMGDYKKALEHAEVAYNRAPDSLNKNALKQAIEKLKNKEDIN